MLHEDLNDINELSRKIEEALQDSNFIELSSLSAKLEKVVQLITENSGYRKNIRKSELDTLEALLSKVNKYQLDTEMKFKDYTLRISKQTKMQNAYKQKQNSNIKMPHDWSSAILSAKKSKFLKETLGPDLHKAFIAIKDMEYQKVASTVSELDIDLYLNAI